MFAGEVRVFRLIKIDDLLNAGRMVFGLNGVF